MRPRARWVLFGVAGTLGLVILVEFAAGEARIGRIGSTPTRQAQQEERPRPALDTGASDADIDGWLQTALARPLLTAGRRPANKPGSGALALRNGLPRLAGTLYGAGGRVAIFARDEGGHPVIVKEGGTLGPYRVTEIAPDSVTLVGPEGRQTLHPRFGTGAPPAITPDSSTDDSNAPPMNIPGTVPPPNYPGLVRPNYPGLIRPPQMGGPVIPPPQPGPQGQSE